MKLTITDPVLKAFPQLSTTSTTIGVGHAAGALNPVPIVVKTGRRLLDVQAGAAVVRGLACRGTCGRRKDQKQLDRL